VTSVEFDLLLALAQHQSMVLSREQLLEKIWGYDYFGDARVVDVHIGHVRQNWGFIHDRNNPRGRLPVRR